MPRINTDHFYLVEFGGSDKQIRSNFRWGMAALFAELTRKWHKLAFCPLFI